MCPVVVPHGTIALIRVFDNTVNWPSTPWNRTCVVPLKPDPTMITFVYIGPPLGENPVKVGAASARTEALICALEAWVACAGEAGTIIRTAAAASAAALSVLL